MRAARVTADLPLPVRWAAGGALALGVLGCAVGLVIGVRVHAATAWAATFEVGVPAAVLGALLGSVAGSLRVLVRRRSHASDG